MLANEETVNAGSVYGCIDGNWDTWTQEQRESKALWECSNGGTRDELRRNFDKDVREGLFLKLHDIEQDFTLVPWNDPTRFLWLLNYSEERQRGDSLESFGQETWRKRRDEFFQKAPDWVMGFIGQPPAFPG